MSTTAHTVMPVAHHFDDAEQQYVAAELGMWLFLATEVLFFGGALCGYFYYRYAYHHEFIAGSHHLDVILGTVNTAVLLTSSLTMVLSVHAAQTGRRGALIANLLFTLLLGAAFLGVKGFEYHHKFEEGLVPGAHFSFENVLHGAATPTSAHQQNGAKSKTDPIASLNPRHAELFFSFYFALTGLHALHMIIGIGVITVLIIAAFSGTFDGGYFTPIEMTGLYWHFVDIVWVFLFPLLYLVR